MKGLGGSAAPAIGVIGVIGAIGVLALGGCGGSPHSSARTHPAASSSAKTVPLATMTKPGAPTTTTSPAAATPSHGGPVPPGTEATSVTFISPDTGFILGSAPCSRKPCSVILETTDRGAHWVGLPAPRESAGEFPGAGLWGLRFADRDHGFAFGHGLWETNDGAGSWHRALGPAPIVLSLEAVQDQELVAVGASCLTGRAGCTERLHLYNAAIGGSWKSVASAPTFNTDASIAVHGPDVWALMGKSLWHSSDGGVSFSSETQPCPTHGANFGSPTSVTDDGAHVYLLCTGQGFTGNTLKYVYATAAPGAPWMLVGKPPSPGDGGEISAGSDNAIVLATASGASLLYRSTDGGRTWKTALTEDDGGVGWTDLGFTTPSQAIVVHGPPVNSGRRPGELLLSTDAGATWRPISF